MTHRLPAVLIRPRGLCFAFLAVLGGLCLPSPALAQMSPYRFSGPQLLYVTPPGGKAGSTVEVTVQGVNLEELRGLHFSHPGIKAEKVGGMMEAPKTPDPKKKPKGMQQAGPAAVTKFKVTIPATTPPGIHDIRLISPGGVSNPRAFVVGDQQEYLEKEPNNDVDQAQKVELNCVVNGVIATPTDVDYCSFTGKKGQRVVVYAQSATIDSKLQPSLQLFTEDGRLLAFNHSYHRTEALLDGVLPDDGTYLVRLSGFAYIAGGLDYFYRLTITTAPWIDAVHPAVLEPGKATQVTVYGRNLPGGKLDPEALVEGQPVERLTTTITAPKEPQAQQRLNYLGAVDAPLAMLDGFEFTLKNASGTSNPVLLHFAQAPVVLDNEKNDTPETAQAVNVPCVISGRFEQKGDRDWYVFTAKKGQVLTIEAIADRLGTSVDLYLQLVSGDTGKTIASLDDNTDTTMPSFYTRTDDPPAYRFTVPADGKYQLLVGSSDSFVQAGVRHKYRVRITPEMPDFRLVALPPLPYSMDGLVVREGGHQFLNVLVYRSDSFTGDILLSAENLPTGVTCKPMKIPAGSTRGVLVFSAADNAPEWTGDVRVVGKATINGKVVERELRSGGPVWGPANLQQAANTILTSRLQRELVLGVRDKAPFSVTATPKETAVLPGKSVTVPITLKRNLTELNKLTFKLTPVNLSKDLTLAPLTLAGGKDQISATIAVKNNATPGMYTVVLLGETDVDSTNPKNKQKVKSKLIQPSTPIIFTVLPTSLAKVKASAASPKLIKGKTQEITVTVNRQFDYDGPFTVKLVSKGKGLTAQEVTIPGGANEAKVVLQTTPDAVLEGGSLTFQVVAMFHGHPVTQEAKLNVTLSSK